MDRQSRWGALVAALALAAFVGVASYDAGVAHGLAINITAGAPAGLAAVPYGWYHPWGPGFFFGPFMFVFFFFLVLRVFVWGGYHRRRWYYPGLPDGPFEEWHRRAHERMNDRPAHEDRAGG